MVDLLMVTKNVHDLLSVWVGQPTERLNDPKHKRGCYLRGWLLYTLQVGSRMAGHCDSEAYVVRHFLRHSVQNASELIQLQPSWQWRLNGIPALLAMLLVLLLLLLPWKTWQMFTRLTPRQCLG